MLTLALIFLHICDNKPYTDPLRFRSQTSKEKDTNSSYSDEITFDLIFGLIEKEILYKRNIIVDPYICHNSIGINALCSLSKINGSKSINQYYNTSMDIFDYLKSISIQVFENLGLIQKRKDDHYKRMGDIFVKHNKQTIFYMNPPWDSGKRDHINLAIQLSLLFNYIDIKSILILPKSVFNSYDSYNILLYKNFQPIIYTSILKSFSIINSESILRCNSEVSKFLYYLSTTEINFDADVPISFVSMRDSEGNVIYGNEIPTKLIDLHQKLEHLLLLLDYLHVMKN